jgi:hypothetical protein
MLEREMLQDQAELVQRSGSIAAGWAGHLGLDGCYYALGPGRPAPV